MGAQLAEDVAQASGALPSRLGGNGDATGLGAAAGLTRTAEGLTAEMEFVDRRRHTTLSVSDGCYDSEGSSAAR